MIGISIATEDELSENVAVKLATKANLSVDLLFRRGGAGYLRSNLQKFSQIAVQGALFLLTDLDSAPCAPALKLSWFGKKPIPSTFVFRVAVREVESWLLADRENLSQLLRCSITRLPRAPDNIEDPKQLLLKLASSAPSSIRAELTARKNAISSQGFGYNSVLSQFVRDNWHIDSAAQVSPSLRRALAQLRLLSASSSV